MPPLGKNSVGSRQLKSKAVKTGKIANNAVNGRKVANNSLTGADINLGQLGTVPSASSATSAQDANTVSGHSAACPAGATLIRGVCYDLALNPVVAGVKNAANACAAKGGYLPTPDGALLGAHVINLGTGVAPDYAVADAVLREHGRRQLPHGDRRRGGKIEEIPIESNTRFICAYALVR